MALFASRRDSGFMASVNREILDRITGMEILYYKLSIDQSPSSIYDETTNKVYYEPVVLGVHIAKQDVQTDDSELGLLESSQTVMFGFLREELERIQLITQVGDIIRWDSTFYEVDNIRKENYWWGRNPDEFVAADRGAVPPQGWAYSVVVEAHRSTMTSVNLQNMRTGVNKLTGPSNRLKGF